MPKASAAKNITRKQALSYDRTVPNGLGVTVISAVNGRGSYERFAASRYKATRRVLGRNSALLPNGDGMFYYKNTESARKLSKAEKKKCAPLVSEVLAAKRKASAKSKPAKSHSPRKMTAAQKAGLKKGRDIMAARRAAVAGKAAPRKAFAPGEQRGFGKLPALGSRERDRLFMERFAIGAADVSARKAASKKAARRKAAPRKAAPRKAAPRKAAPRKAAHRKAAPKKYKRITALFMRANKKFGYRMNMTAAQADLRAANLKKGRELLALKRAGAFDVVAAPAPAKPKKRKPRKPVSPRLFGAQYKSHRVRVGKRGHSNVIARVGNKGIATYMYLDRNGKARKLPSWMIAGAPSPKAFKEKPAYAARLVARRQKASGRVSKKILQGRYPFTPNKPVVTFDQWEKSMKKKHKKSKARRNPLMQAAANRKKRRVRKHPMHHNPLMQAAANKKRRGRKHAVHSRRKHGRMRRNGQTASYISNMGQYASDLFEVMKSGAVVGGGLVVHKALTNVLLDQAFKKVDFLQKLNPKYQRSLAAVVVAAVGIPLSTKFGGSLGKKLSMGMGAALIHTVFSEILGSAKPAYQHYLGSYTEADKSFGSYYEFQPGQSYSGMGEYIQQSGSMAGFGGLHQAAAGFGSPALQQAAAGVGEYIVQGAEGIGEYEEVRPEFTAPAHIREGITPSLGNAEHALNMAEAAAGIGGFGNTDLSLEQIVYPEGQALDIDDQPGGSRAGVFYGSSGVFGN